jgi:hypothetical protein
MERRRDGVADYGYAASAWVLDLLAWLNSDAVPLNQQHRIVGLLLGYGVAAIRSFEEEGSGRRFGELTLAAPASS